MKQQYKNQWYKPKIVQRINGNPGTYWVKSETHNQLWYKVVLRPEQDVYYCACEAHKYSGGKQICKHILRVIETENSGII